jgi:hypothetical protein
MIIEFARHGKTYQCSVAAPVEDESPPPPTIRIPFRPCVLKPPFQLELIFLATDEVRGIELYKPVAEVY